MLKEYLIIMAQERIVPRGLALSVPAMSGALPCMGSYIALLRTGPREADGNMPIDPVSMDASSESISPKVFSVTITSNCFGFLINCMEQLSTYICESSTSGYSEPTSVTTFLHSSVDSRTFALSTLTTFFRRSLATSKATTAILSISVVV